MARKAKEKWEYGDFQTPMLLAKEALQTLISLNFQPQTILEPTCGKGAFLLAATYAYPQAQQFIGVEVNEQHLVELKKQAVLLAPGYDIQLLHNDFFLVDWRELLNNIPQPILITGNPPWVTSSDLGLLSSSNLPQKSNFEQRRGYEAITGKSNFDISEWMLLQYVNWLNGRRGVIAVLCKTAVARKVLLYLWEKKITVSNAKIFAIDAQKQFGASVEACFFTVEMSDINSPINSPAVCEVYETLNSNQPSHTIGFSDNTIISNMDHYEKWRHIRGKDKAYTWRSGIKHDCSKVMELERNNNVYRNGMDEQVAIEDDYVYPMLKSSDISNGEIRYGRKYMLVPQSNVGKDTAPIKRIAPATWRYLETHAHLLERRASSIYRNQPKYSIFGVGSYSFSKWKIAISGFYKKLAFKVIEPYQEKPVVLDDTVYFLPCWSASEAHFLEHLLNSEPARQLLESMIFWSDKRPITIELLKRLNLQALSIELGLESTYLRFALQHKDKEAEEVRGQLSFGIAET